MQALSIVIIVKNEAQNIRACLEALQGLSDDILVVDTGSTDETIDIATSLNARVIQLAWGGYGATKNEANQLAKYDTILSLDADEVMNESLKKEIQALDFIDSNTAYLIQRKMMYCGQLLQFGSTANEYRLRLFNRHHAAWNTNEVHEEIIFKNEYNIKKLNGYLLHYSFPTIEAQRERFWHYAKLHAEQMKENGIKVSWIKKVGSPLFSFIKNYIFKLGFLDGRLGFIYAKNEMQYVKLKYSL